jgi:hypothetical protein
VSFHGSIASPLLLLLNNFTLSGHTIVSLSSCLLEDILVASKFWQFILFYYFLLIIHWQLFHWQFWVKLVNTRFEVCMNIFELFG